ncbi:MAG TPA: anti-sigma factor [Burkholderiales bacterium]|nr:anti-sigma factor [Burkholderiales bacterium]
MDCTETRRHLHPYLDQELDRANVAAVDEHLASCEHCKGIFATQLALRSGLRRHASYHRAPRALAARIRARAGGERKARWQWPALGRWLPVGAAAAAAAVISWTAALQYASVPASQIATEQVVSAHARSIVTSQLIQVASSDQHTVKPWLSSKLDFSPPVPDLSAAGFPLVGGRMDYLNDRVVAALVYRSRQHIINLFVCPDRHAKTVAMESRAKDGYNVLRWTDGGMAFWAVSDVNAADLKHFADQYASAE